MTKKKIKCYHCDRHLEVANYQYNQHLYCWECYKRLKAEINSINRAVEQAEKNLANAFPTTTQIRRMLSDQ